MLILSLGTSPARFEAFEYACTQIPEEQALSVTIVPNEAVLATVLAQLKGDDVQMANSLLGGKGLCLYTDFGVAAEPKVGLLVLTPSADDATKIQAVAEAGIAELKRQMPPAFSAGIDTLKAAAAGANVQVSTDISHWSAIIKAVIAQQLAGHK